MCVLPLDRLVDDAYTVGVVSCPHSVYSDLSQRVSGSCIDERDELPRAIGTNIVDGSRFTYYIMFNLYCLSCASNPFTGQKAGVVCTEMP
jgi:hypothetical protein